MGETMYFFDCDYCQKPSQKRLADYKHIARGHLKRPDGTRAAFCSLSCMAKWREDYYDNSGVRQERIEELIEKRYWAKVDKTLGQGPKGDCWEWKGAKFSSGYGRYAWRIGRHKEQGKIATRAYYELILKQDISNINVLHTCDNPPCVRPDHLFLGTHQDNSDDKVSKKRHLFGEDAKQSKVTEAQVLEMRRVAKEMNGPKTEKAKFLKKELCLPLKIESIVGILSNNSWKHLL